MKWWTLILFVASIGTGCAGSRNFDPSAKFSKEQLRADFSIFRQSLEESHPALYWYTPKDSLDFYFDKAYGMITDSMQEYRFRYLLSSVISKIRCGHTSVLPSKAASRYASSTTPFALPISVKAWPDSVMVTGYLNRRDTLMRRGYLITSIEGRPIKNLLDTFFNYIPSDGYNLTNKYQILSNGAGFRTMYASIFGLRFKMPVEYIDTSGVKKHAVLPVYNPVADTPRVRRPPVKISRKERRELMRASWRDLRIDTANSTAVMEVNTFSRNRGLRSFFSQSFKTLKKLKIKYLILDLRGNGGGHVPLSNLLTKYLADTSFKVADSLYATRRGSAFGDLRSDNFLNSLFLFFLTRKEQDGNYHFNLYEGKYFKPKSSNHFEGTTYILTGGNTFSAASLVTKILAPQENVITVGEETGGSSYGNAAWLIPDVTLPYTKVRFRLPLFRLVMDKDAVKGEGVKPEIPSLPTWDALRAGKDFKMQAALDDIKRRSQKN